jgi:hypothetical protein
MGKAPVVGGGIGNTVINNKWDATSDFEDLRTDVGDKTTLTTTDKTNLVNAVNETKAQINDLDALVGLGGVVESGSNVNGEYIRFEDGTQICWKPVTLVSPGGTYMITLGNGPTANPYPASFITSQKGVLGIKYMTSNTTREIFGSIFYVDAISGTTTWGRIRFALNSGLTIEANQTYETAIFAIGRWK